MELGVDDVREILKIFAESEMQRIHIEVGDVRLSASKQGTGAEPIGSPSPDDLPLQEVDDRQVAVAQAPEPMARPRERPFEGLHELTAPVLGVFYRSPAPSEPPFVEVGSEVDASDPVCIIDVMKLFNRVTAGQRGRVVEICVDDGAEVQFGQTLMWIQPAEGHE